MTLCVAAQSSHSIVFATDKKIEGAIASADIGRKQIMLSDNWFPALMAGTQTRALELAFEIARLLAQWDKTIGDDQDNMPPPWEGLLREAVKLQKANIAAEIVSSAFGVSYKEFLEIGKTSFPDDIHREVVSEIPNASVDCWLLVLGFKHVEPRIFRLSETGTVETCDNFAAIGSGASIAEASLFQRNQQMTNDLGTTIYNVYEAMRLGSIAPGVGDTFGIGVAVWDWYEHPNPHNRGEVTTSYIGAEYFEYLDSEFRKYGPRPVTKVRLRPRWIREERRMLVLTPKGEMDPRIIAKSKRSKAARKREAKKRLARQSGAQKSEGQQ